MKIILILVFGLVLLVTAVQCQNSSKSKEMKKKSDGTSIYQFSFEDSKGKVVSMSDYKGKTLLIVNVASKCGFTKQYAPLEAMYKKLADKGFVILAFPCNQFLGQEPGTNEEIQEFCSSTYGVEFPVFGKIQVNGSGAHPLYVWLKAQTGNGAIKWNFNKFLIDKEGKMVKRYDSGDSLDALEKDVIAIL